MSATLQDLMHMEPWEWPEEAQQTVVDALSNRALPEADRLAAVIMAGNPGLIDNAVAKKLLAMLQDVELTDDLRGQVAISLGPVLEECDMLEFDEPGMVPIAEKTFKLIQETLQTVYPNAPDLVRRRILEAAVRAPQPWQADAIRQAWASTETGWRVTAVFCMGFVPGFDSIILQALESSDAELFYEAVVAAGSRGVAAAWDRVLAIVQHPPADKELLLAAIPAVASIRPAEARAVLADLLDDDDPEVVEVTEEVLDMLAPPLDEEAAEDEDEVEVHECTDPTHHHGPPVVQAVSNKVGRNEPCPCGSGKKYKKCCLASGPETPAAGPGSALN